MPIVSTRENACMPVGFSSLPKMGPLLTWCRVQSTSANRAPPAGRKQKLTCFCDFCVGSRGPSKRVAEHDGRRDIAPIRQPLSEAQVLSTSVPWHLAAWVTSAVGFGSFSIAGVKQARVSQESPSSWHHSLIAISFCLAVSGSGPLRGLPVKSPARVQLPMTRRHHVRAVHVVGGAGAYELSVRFEWQHVRYRFARSPAHQHRLETPTNQRVCAMCPRDGEQRKSIAFCILLQQTSPSAFRSCFRLAESAGGASPRGTLFKEER